MNQDKTRALTLPLITLMRFLLRNFVIENTKTLAGTGPDQTPKTGARLRSGWTWTNHCLTEDFVDVSEDFANFALFIME